MTSRKIKLLIGVNNFCVAGAQKLAADYLNAFDKEKYELALLTFFQPEEEKLFDLLPPCIRNYRLDFKNFWDIKGWFKVYGVLKKLQPDFVLSHLFFSNTVLRILKPFFSYQIIIYEHNLYINKTRLQILADKILSNFTFKIIADSQAIKDFTVKQEKIRQSKFAVIPCPVNYDEIQSQIAGFTKNGLRQKLGLVKEGGLLINVARLVRQKNHQFLIESFTEFSRKYPNYKLIVLGEGSLRNQLEEQIRNLKMTDKIFLLGQKRNVIEYLFASDIFVLTSSTEGFPIACLEALAVGLPVVSSNLAGVRECITNGYNGYVTETNSKQDLALAIDKIAARGPALFSENCRATARKFDIQRIISLTEGLFLA